jgi:hypothetical protein
MTNDEIIKNIERRLDGLSNKGDWVFSGTDEFSKVFAGDTQLFYQTNFTGRGRGSGNHANDLSFIAHAPKTIKWLISLLKSEVKNGTA